MKKLFAPLLLLVAALSLSAQSIYVPSNGAPVYTQTQNTDPSGSCATPTLLVLNYSSGALWACEGAPGSYIFAKVTASPSAGTTQTIANGTVALGTSSIASGSCASAVTATATGVLSTDVVTASFNGDPTSTTGYVPLSSGMLTIVVYPGVNLANFKVCNNTSQAITPGAITLNWRVAR